MQTFWFIFFATDVSLQSIFKSSLNSEKTSGCQMNKKMIFESISMTGAFRGLFNPNMGEEGREVVVLPPPPL